MSDIKYPSNVLEGFGSGALLDLRVRLAADFLKHGAVVNLFPVSTPDDLRLLPKVAAGYALDLADELLSQAEVRGWVDPLPADDGELPPDLRAQANRTGSYQAQQQLGANKYAADEAGRVVPGAHVLANGRMN